MKWNINKTQTKFCGYFEYEKYVIKTYHRQWEKKMEI